MAKKKTVVEEPTTTEVIDTTSTPVNTEAIKEAINNVDTTIKNDFEETVFVNHPELAAIKRSLYDSGAVYASMSGSGSALFAVYRK